MTARSVFSVLLFSLLFSIPDGVAGKEEASLHDIPGKFTDQDGASVRFSEWKKTPLVVTMTYTSCQYACPRIMEKMKVVQKVLRSQGRSPRFVIVTFDPRRDTAAALKKQKLGLSDPAKDWIFLTGSEADVRRASMVLGIRFEGNPETGDITHDNKILVTDASGKVTHELSGLDPNPEEVERALK